MIDSRIYAITLRVQELLLRSCTGAIMLDFSQVFTMSTIHDNKRYGENGTITRTYTELIYV